MYVLVFEREKQGILINQSQLGLSFGAEGG